MNDITTTTFARKLFYLQMIPRYYYYSHPDISSKINLINKELREISNWFKANELSVNASKTNYMMLGTSHITNNL